MSYTNSTTYFNLPQWLTTDVPSWLSDVNNAFLTIDTNLHTAATNASSAADAVTALDTRLDTAEGKITTLEGSVSQDEQNIIALQSRVTSAESSITSLESKSSVSWSNIGGTQITPLLLSNAEAWDSAGDFLYYYDFTLTGMTATMFIEDLVMNLPAYDVTAPYSETRSGALRLFFANNDPISVTLYSVIAKEL